MNANELFQLIERKAKSAVLVEIWGLILETGLSVTEMHRLIRELRIADKLFVSEAQSRKGRSPEQLATAIREADMIITHVGVRKQY